MSKTQLIWNAVCPFLIKSFPGMVVTMIETPTNIGFSITIPDEGSLDSPFSQAIRQLVGRLDYYVEKHYKDLTLPIYYPMVLSIKTESSEAKTHSTQRVYTLTWQISLLRQDSLKMFIDAIFSVLPTVDFKEISG